jgi:hypothetical protein
MPLDPWDLFLIFLKLQFFCLVFVEVASGHFERDVIELLHAPFSSGGPVFYAMMLVYVGHAFVCHEWTRRWHSLTFGLLSIVTLIAIIMNYKFIDPNTVADDCLDHRGPCPTLLEQHVAVSFDLATWLAPVWAAIAYSVFKVVRTWDLADLEARICRQCHQIRAQYWIPDSRQVPIKHGLFSAASSDEAPADGEFEYISIPGS